MPARSKAQRIAAAIAEHHPNQLYARNQGLAQMSPAQLHEFAATKTKGLPRHVKKAKSQPVIPNRYGRTGR